MRIAKSVQSFADPGPGLMDAVWGIRRPHPDEQRRSSKGCFGGCDEGDRGRAQSIVHMSMVSPPLAKLKPPC